MKTLRLRRTPGLLALVGCLALLTHERLRADGFAPQGETASGTELMPKVDVVNQIGTQLPLDAVLRDEKGNPITLGQAVGGKPTLLVFGYFHCPQLCNQVLTNLVDRMRKIKPSAGEAYNLVTVSVDPKDTPLTAWSWKKNYTEQYGREGVERGWHFLTAKEPEIDLLTRAAGFQYEEIAKPLFQPVGSERKNKEYAHPAVVVVLTPGGVVSRYLFNLKWSADELDRAIREAAEGLGEFEKPSALFRCFMSYDPHAKKYTMDVWRSIRTVGVVTLLLVAFWVARELIRGPRRRSPVSPAGSSASA